MPAPTITIVVRGLFFKPTVDVLGLMAWKRTSKLNATCDWANHRAPPP
jgi:hypothetical protein